MERSADSGERPSSSPRMMAAVASPALPWNALGTNEVRVRLVASWWAADAAPAQATRRPPVGSSGRAGELSWRTAISDMCVSVLDVPVGVPEAGGPLALDEGAAGGAVHGERVDESVGHVVA